MSTLASFPGSILRSVFLFEAAKVRSGPGIRRAVVLALVMGGVGLWSGWGLAVGSGVAALLVGMLEFQQPRRERWQTMALGTLGLATVTFVTHLLAPFPAAILLLFMVIAFCEGSSISLHRNAPVVLHLMGLTAAAVLLNPMRAEDWISPTLAVLFGGGFQTVVTYCFDHLSRYDFERSALKNSLIAVAQALRRTAEMLQDPSLPYQANRTHDAVEHAARSMTEAFRAIQSPATPSDRRESIGALLLAVDRIRIESKAIFTDIDFYQITAEAGETRQLRLLELAELLEKNCRSLEKNDGPLDGGLPHEPDGDPANNFLCAMAAFRLSDSRPFRTKNLSPLLECRNALTRWTHTLRATWRFGFRLVVATVLASLAGVAFDLVHASWAAATCLSVLRPDGGASLTRILLRALANALAAGIVLSVVPWMGVLVEHSLNHGAEGSLHAVAISDVIVRDMSVLAQVLEGKPREPHPSVNASLDTPQTELEERLLKAQIFAQCALREGKEVGHTNCPRVSQ